MSEQQVLTTVGTALVAYCALVGTASVLVHLRVNWRDSIMGRHLFWYMAVLAVTLDLAVIRAFFGDSDWFALLRLAVFIGLPIVMTQRLILQIKAQHDARKKENDSRG